MDKQEEVLHFIGLFTANGKREQVIECFTSGCCYYFAVILTQRFEQDHTILMYAEIDNHFGCQIGDKIYDITGDVTDQYQWGSWAAYCEQEPKHSQYIEKCCVTFEV